MLALMSLRLQKQHEEINMSSILAHLREQYGTCAKAEHYKVSSALYDNKLA